MSDAPATRSLPTLPLKNSILFSHLAMPLAVARPASLATVEAALASEDKTLLVVAQRDGSVDEPTRAQLYEIGTLAVIKRMERSDSGVKILVEGTERARLLEVRQERPFLDVCIQAIPEPSDTGADREALQGEMRAQAARIQAIVAGDSPIGLPQILAQTNNPLQQVYLLASLLGLDVAKGQALLEAETRLQALQFMHEYLAHELQVLELRQKIAEQAQTEMSREQREYLLRQQLRAIQEELGEKNPEQAEVAELRRRFDEVQLPELVRKEADRELRRLERLPAAAADYQVIRGYLDLVLELPWTKQTDDALDIPHARQVLDEDHYDLKEVKERIVEQLAVLKLNPAANAPILCFVGPPGVGKTSLGQSIARSLGRKFERISLGGLHDEAELRGHRRTYIGAMPGRIIQAMRRAGVRNPVLMLDEVDKLGHGFRGDPAAALMEILDPAQNVDFRDNYLETTPCGGSSAATRARRACANWNGPWAG
jgi:ATP-dependent Lon protease